MNYAEFNESQTEVCSLLRTLKGSVVRRSKLGVGKEIGGKLYFHKNYVCPEILNKQALKMYTKYRDECPFEFNLIRYNLDNGDVSLVECPDFDTAREPVVGRYFTISYSDLTVLKSIPYTQIFHHKWLFVKDDYTGFDLKESWEWSKKWLSVLTEPADGSSLQNWQSQLAKFNLQ